MPVKAVLHTGLSQAWASVLGAIPWPLLPFGNRPFIEYWIEECLALGIQDIRLVLGEGAEFVEAYAGDGERWGVSISYSFLRDGADPDSFLKRNPESWTGGLFYLRAPVFFHRLAVPSGPAGFPGGLFLERSADGGLDCLLTDDAAAIEAFINNPRADLAGRAWEDLNLRPALIRSVKDYYTLNMSLVGEASERYVRADYSLQKEVSIGYNVIMPPSVAVTPPVAVGNHCRIGAMTSVGPQAVVGNHVILDRQAELSGCVILDGTYIGRGVEIRGKIVAGNRVIDPDEGEVAEINEPWLVSSVRSVVRGRDLFRALSGWATAAVLVLCQAGPFCLLYPFVKLLRQGRFRHVSVHLTRNRVGRLPDYAVDPARETGLGILFRALNLDLFPQFCRVVTGHLWLCGVRPMRSPGEDALRHSVDDYFPSVLVYEADEREAAEPGAHLAHALYYARFRSVLGDVKMVLSLMFTRPLLALSSAGNSKG